MFAIPGIDAYIWINQYMPLQRAASFAAHINAWFSCTSGYSLKEKRDGIQYTMTTSGPTCSEHYKQRCWSFSTHRHDQNTCCGGAWSG